MWTFHKAFLYSPAIPFLPFVRVVNIRKWKCLASSPFPSPHPSHFPSFGGGGPSATSHQGCLQSNTCPQLLGSETKGTSQLGDGWLVGLCFLLGLQHGCHTLSGLFILWRRLCLVVIILAHLGWLLAVCQPPLSEFCLFHSFHPCYRPVKQVLLLPLYEEEGHRKFKECSQSHTASKWSSWIWTKTV